jgi:hypothetical protein
LEEILGEGAIADELGEEEANPARMSLQERVEELIRSGPWGCSYSLMFRRPHESSGKMELPCKSECFGKRSAPVSVR